MTDEQIERYSRHIILKEVGAKGQKKLLKGKVLIIGAGGLGAPAAMYLAAAGVGTIGIVDADEVDLSNLQRQIIHSTADIGKAKVKSAKETMNAMNPDVEVKTYRMFVDASNIRELIREYDFIIDLAAFLFRNDDCFKLIGSLSGGEKARVLLCKIMLSDSNFLILDEPTNHLDIFSKEALEDALKSYPGTILAVSHDRYFINALADKIYKMADHTLTLYNGNYDYFLEKSQDEEPEKKAEAKSGADKYKKRKEAESARRKAASRLKRTEGYAHRLSRFLCV